MIEIKNLTRRYGNTVAVNNVSFTIPAGQITGLLGPNGAGKTTTLRIITGYLAPTSGSVRVWGFDVQENPLEAKRRIGYLPESNPLYEELSVWEYLNWIASIRNLHPGKHSIKDVIELCSLKDVTGKDIGQLSKGYRQRLGLAQAILHDPEILILDEPTSGLDPNQQREVRELINSFKAKKTVLVSTHILSEAKAVCDRVLIISRGQIAADGSPQELETKAKGKNTLKLVLKSPETEAREAISLIDGIEGIETLGSENGVSTFNMTLTGISEKDPREPIFELAAQRHWPILEMRPESATLEDVFHELTSEPNQNA